MAPLPGTHLIHRNFQAHHRRTVQGQLTATCIIWRPPSAAAATGFDEQAGRSVYPDPARVYAGPCRVQAGGGSAAPVVAGGLQVTASQYALVIPVRGVPLVKVDDLVEVTGCPDDPHLVTGGPALVVTAVPRGSILWQQDAVCDLYPATTR